MFSNPSPRTRLLAVLALVLVAIGAAYVLINSSSKSSNEQTTSPITTAQTSTTATTTSEKPKNKKKEKVEGVAALDAALLAHPVVVVSVYADNVGIDLEALNEARAGAAEAGAGFASFDVYDETQARQLADLLSGSFEVSNPEVLFFERPRRLVFELQGVVDSKVVAQAAQNIHPRVEPWVGTANGICARYATSFAAAANKARSFGRDTPAARDKTASAVVQAASILDRKIKALAAVRVNVGKAELYGEMLSALRKISADFRSEAAAIRSNELDEAEKIEKAILPQIQAANRIASNLELTICAS
jgi:hypothetical protein